MSCSAAVGEATGVRGDRRGCARVDESPIHRMGQVRGFGGICGESSMQRRPRGTGGVGGIVWGRYDGHGAGGADVEGDIEEASGGGVGGVGGAFEVRG